MVYNKARTMWVDYAFSMDLDRHFLEGMWELLWHLYHIPKREYHGLGWHIPNMLNTFYRFRVRNPDFTRYWNEIEWAIWFHDIYCDPSRTDNELRSQQLGACLTDAYTKLDYNKVSHCIWATMHGLSRAYKNLEYNSSSSEEKLICDLDLAGFLDTEHIVMESERRIRAEYPTVSDEDYRRGRNAFLNELLGRGYIFLTDEFKRNEGHAYESIIKIMHS